MPPKKKETEPVVAPASKRRKTADVTVSRVLVTTAKKKEHVMEIEFECPVILSDVADEIADLDASVNGEDSMVGWEVHPFDIDFFGLKSLDEVKHVVGKTMKKNAKALESTNLQIEELQKQLEELQKQRGKLGKGKD
jgi:hypothetical protein